MKSRRFENVENAELVKPFVDSLRAVLSTMAGVESEVVDRAQDDVESTSPTVAGIIGIVGDKLKGSLAITFSGPCFLALATEMLGEQIDEIDNDCAEMAGEIVNMTMGGAKISLGEQGYDFELSIPATIWGENVEVKHNAQTPVQVVAMETEHGRFALELCVVRPEAVARTS